MTKFVKSFSTQQLLPPWESTGCSTWSFAVRVHKSTVQGYVDKYFNGDYAKRSRRFKYAPLPGPQFGLLTVALRPNTFSVRPGAARDNLGFREVHWSFPVNRRRINADNRMVGPTETVWVQPFLFCDNATVVFSSREIWGSNTIFASILPHPDPPSGDLHVDVAIDGIRKFSPRAHNEELGCLHIRTGTGHQFDWDRVAEEPGLRGFIKSAAECGMIPVAREGRALRPTLPGIVRNNLKQFRDIEDMNEATYRAIVATQTTHTKVSHLTLYDCSEIVIDFMWSDSIAEMLRTLFDLRSPTEGGPPHEHEAGRSPADGINWDLDRASLKAVLGFSFGSDVSFKVLDTLQTYCD
jgi:hypothetical protein